MVAMIRESLSIVWYMLLWVAVFFLGFFVLLIIMFTWKIPLHTYQLRVLQRHFHTEVQAFPNSVLRSEMREFGNFGQSNHCDYIVGEFRSSPLPKEEIAQFYTGTSVHPFDKTSRLPVEIYFAEDLHEAALHDYYWEYWLEKYIPTQKDAVDDHTYFVFTMSAMHPPDGDFRCH